MYPVSQTFQDAAKASERQVLARVMIDYTDGSIDTSLQITPNETNRVSYASQVVDGIETIPQRWNSLDGTWVLDGTWHLAPGTAVEAAQYQMGWWGNTLAGAGGAFAVPYPTLTVAFLSRPVLSLLVAGDSARGEYPVDFHVRLYSAGNVLLHEEIVTGNAGVNWSKDLTSIITQVVKTELEVRKWSHSGRVVKIAEFFTSIRETYEGDGLLEVALIEEREVSQGSLPVGNISANEVTIRLNNADRRFDADNTLSPLYQLLKPNRFVRGWLGVVLPDTSVEWVPLGTFWSVDWHASEDTVEAGVVARDRLESLRKSTYYGGTVQQNATLYDLAAGVLADAGLQAGEYWVDTDLQAIVVPYAWFNPVSHREALRLIAEAGLAAVYCDRDGVIRMDSPGAGLGAVSVLTIDADNYSKLSNPMRQSQVANEVVAQTKPLTPAAAPEEVYRSSAGIAVAAGQTLLVTVQYSNPPVTAAVASLEAAGPDTSISAVTYYAWGAEVGLYNAGAGSDSPVLVLTGTPLVEGSGERAVARDTASISEIGVLRYQFADNHLVQTRDVAQTIVDTILASAADSRRDSELEWRGNPALELGDRVTVKSQDYHAIRQELHWSGALSARMTGRRATS